MTSNYLDIWSDIIGVHESKILMQYIIKLRKVIGVLTSCVLESSTKLTFDCKH